MSALEEARYVSLATYRRDGREVATPVWAAHEGGVWYVFSAGDAGKVKRLRARSKARLATCDMRGGNRGEWHDAEADLIDDPEEIGRALAALRRKYGFAMRLADLGARLTGRYRKRAYIRVRLVEPQSTGDDSLCP